MRNEIKTSLIITITIFLGIYCFVSYFDKGKFIYLNNKNNTQIEVRIKEDIKQCGFGYYGSLFSLKDYLSNFGFKKMMMITQWGYLDIKGIRNIILPTKSFNKDWSKSISIDDRKSIKLINSFKNGKPIYFEDLNDISDIPIVKKLIDRSALKPKTATITIIKDRNNIIYAYFITNISQENKNCEEEKAIKTAEETAKFIKKLL
jgi:hypothetical protein